MRALATTTQGHQVATGLNTLCLLGICAALAVAFYYQLALFDLPCPLCLLQRAGLIIVGLGFFFNICLGIRNTHYGMVLVGGLTTLAIAMRQVFLHIAPGDPGYGGTFLGMHFYTWAAVASLACILAVALMMVFEERIRGGGVADKNEYPGFTSASGKWAAALFILLIAGNLVSTVLECGAGACADDPVAYQLLPSR